jgi:hypothetical protein
MGQDTYLLCALLRSTNPLLKAYKDNRNRVSAYGGEKERVHREVDGPDGNSQ